jgi:tRNA (cmo5U34)-methyltransferase
MGDNTTPHKSTEYDSNINKTIPYYKNFHSETIDLIKNYGGKQETWLDIGGGTGTLIQKAKESFKDTKFILCDPSENMIEIAKSKFATDEKVDFISNCTSQELDRFLSEKVDIITAIQVNHYLNKDDRLKATKNSFNLLNNGGIYITFENIKPLSELGTTIGLARWGEFQLAQGRETEVVDDHKSRFNKEYFPINILEHLEVLKNSGFKNFEIFWLSHMQAGFYAIK